MPPPDPVGPKVQVLERKTLTVDYAAEAWSDDATELVKKLLKVKGVAAAKVGEKCKLEITLDGVSALDEAELKKQIKEAGMNFVALAAAAKG